MAKPEKKRIKGVGSVDAGLAKEMEKAAKDFQAATKAFLDASGGDVLEAYVEYRRARIEAEPGTVQARADQKK